MRILFSQISKICFAVFLFIIILTSNTAKAQGGVSSSDYISLLNLYYSTSSGPWTNSTNWTTASPVSTWYGVTVNGSSVSQLILSSNNLVGDITYWNPQFSSIQKLDLSNNHLSGTVPIGLSSTFSLYISNNKFTFNGIEDLINAGPFGIFNYSPQAKIPISKRASVLAVSAGGTLSNNTYSWYRDNTLVATNTGDSTYTIPITDYGKYSVAVTNAVANQLTLYSDSVMVNTDAAPIVASDSLALIDLYNSTNGAHWKNNTNWLTTNPIKTWYGVTVNNGRIITINLNSDSLNGTIPTTIYKLSNLTSLSLNSNQLNGSIPYQLALLPNLVGLDLSTNQLSGNIPDIFTNGYLTKLNTLILGGNQLTGTIPSSIDKAPGLINLELAVNKLSGSIPAEIGSLPNLVYLYLNNNQFTGSIPSTIGNLSNLNFLDFGNNQLTGNIPNTIGNLKKLWLLSFYRNQLTGSLPDSIGSMSGLGVVWLYYNQLSGSIPPSICNLSTSLLEFDVQYNQLSGDIPDSIGKLTKLNAMHLNNNQFNGNVAPLKNLVAMQQLYIDDNKLNFNGIEAVVQAHHFLDAYSTYAPQATIPLTQTGNKFSVSAGGALSNNTYKWYKDSVLIATITGDSTYIPTATGKYSVAVTNSIATKLTLYCDTLKPNNISDTTLCSNAGFTLLHSSLSGAQYQWQVSTDGITYNNIGDNFNYANTNTADLSIGNINSGLYGYHYRCVVDGANSNIYVLKFANYWIGIGSDLWSDEANWSCGLLPDVLTDVYIGSSSNVVIDQNAFCRSITISPGATVTVQPGAALDITH